MKLPCLSFVLCWAPVYVLWFFHFYQHLMVAYQNTFIEYFSLKEFEFYVRHNVQNNSSAWAKKNQGHLFNLCNSKLKWRFCKERYNPINMKMISKEGLKYGYIGTKQAYNYFFLFVEVLMFQTHTYIHIHIYRYRLHWLPKGNIAIDGKNFILL